MISISAGVMALGLLFASQGGPGAKKVPGLPKQARYDVQGEITYIGQEALPFHSAHSSGNSFPSRGVAAATDTAEVYLGIRPIPNVELYANPELAAGSAPGAGLGLAGYSNQDLIGQPVYGSQAFLARSFVRWRIPIRQGKDQPVGQERVGRAPNVIAGPVPQHRLVVTAGKFAVSDIFDFNSYANNPRIQFLNRAFTNNLAYDFAQDARGMDYGASVVLVNPSYAVRFGSFAVPTVPGGQSVRYNPANAHSEQLEVELNPQVLRSPKPPLTVRLLGFRNVGMMGSYEEALSAAPVGSPPSLSGVRRSGTTRIGYELNLEQGLADGGQTGLFARIGWADGGIETQSYAEADESDSVGLQLSGAKWKRKDDVAGFAFGTSSISASHQRYLAEGGAGFNLGDGALKYGGESVFEMYYLYQFTKTWQFSGDFQQVANPGYNEVRGPCPILSIRARYSF